MGSEQKKVIRRLTQHKRFVPFTALTQIPPSAELLLCWERYTQFRRQKG